MDQSVTLLSPETRAHFGCMRLLTFFAIGFVVMGRPVFAWDAGGHEIVAWIAQDHLNAQARAALDQMAPKVQGPITFNPINLACWMDIIKGHHPGMPFLGLFRSWHYIDFGLKDSDPSPATVPGQDNEEHGNAVLALQRAYVVLQGGTDPYIPSKEIAVAMVLHLVGDIHQPLHAASAFSMRHGRLESDAGGNKVMILNGPITDSKGDRLNLHYFWDASWRASFDSSTNMVSLDSAFDDKGAGIDLQSVRPLAAQFQKEFPPDPALNLEPDFLGWAKESNHLARTIAYAHLMEGPGSPEVRLNEAYVLEANQLAKQRIVIAGLRLAQLLNETLGAPAKIPPPTPWPAGPPAPPPAAN